MSCNKYRIGEHPWSVEFCGAVTVQYMLVGISKCMVHSALLKVTPFGLFKLMSWVGISILSISTSEHCKLVCQLFRFISKSVGWGITVLCKASTMESIYGHIDADTD